MPGAGLASASDFTGHAGDSPRPQSVDLPTQTGARSPEILASLTFGPLVKHLLGGSLVGAVMAGGGFMLVAAILAQWVDEAPTRSKASVGSARSSEALAS